MGGYGSGRWQSHTKKDTVEQCKTLDIADFRRKGYSRRGGGLLGDVQVDGPAGERDGEPGLDQHRRRDPVVLHHPVARPGARAD